MMKKILIFLTAVLALPFFAQSQRFYYEYKYTLDSTNKELNTEMMILEVNSKGSKYYSHDRFVQDSTIQADLQKQIKAGSGNLNITKKGNSKVNYSVTKSYPDYKVLLETAIGQDRYKVIEPTKPEWKILPEKKTIGTYQVQKAETSLGGRKWTAWFTTDIPLNDGPYKFYGLPGFIVQVIDDSETHSISLVGSRKLTTESVPQAQMPSGVTIMGMGGSAIEITKDKFKKLWQDFVNDPSKNMREMLMKNIGGSTIQFKVKNQDGSEISDPNQVFKSYEQRIKDQIKKENNLIEPSLYK